MGAIIESVAAVVSHRPMVPKGALALADEAVRDCLSAARIRPTEVDLLINAGVYREKNLVEPALASMIQEDIGANPGHPPSQRSQGTFSFDLGCGGCGPLVAVELIDGFMRSNTIAVGVVVASDSNPEHTEGFPFPNAGAAVLLRAGPEHAGFAAFASETFPEFADAFEARVTWHAHAHRGLHLSPGHNDLALAEHDDFSRHAIECATTATERFLKAHELRGADVDLLIASSHPPAFVDGLADRLGIGENRIARAPATFHDAHTAGPLAALDAAARSERLAGAKNVLFVTVGAGITVATALYRPAASK